MIEAEKANYKIAWMCRLLRVPRSSFYAWLGRTETPSAARRRALGVEVARVFAFGRSAFGGRRVTAQLNREGHECSVGLVADLMRELGLAAVQPRAYKRTTTRGEDPQDSPDLLERDFAAGPDAGAPGTRLVGDITYLKTGEGWLYLATVIDLATRMVVGWQLADHMRTSLNIEALAMARGGGHLQREAIFHSAAPSTRRSSFTSTARAFRSGPASGGPECAGTAVAESFFSALKNEMFHHHHFPTRARARFAVADYIEVFYNRRRLHSTLGYRTPFEALTDYRTAAVAA